MNSKFADASLDRFTEQLCKLEKHKSEIRLGDLMRVLNKKAEGIITLISQGRLKTPTFRDQAVWFKVEDVKAYLYQRMAYHHQPK